MEWMLDQDIFNVIMKRVGGCNIDMIAASNNHKLPQYVSYLPDPKAFAINTLLLKRSKFNSYMFPSFSVTGAVLQKVEMDKAEAVLIAPLFTTQPWFPRLLQMVISNPILLPKGNRVLINPKTKEFHPMEKLQLCVFKISGNNYAVEGFHKKLQRPSYAHGETVRKNNMGRGCHFVVNIKLLHVHHL